MTYKKPQPLPRTTAEACLGALLAQFKAHIEAGANPPKLYEPGFHTTGWAIGWEEGPYDWPQIAFRGGTDEEVYEGAMECGATAERAKAIATIAPVDTPAGVYAEAVNGWCLGLYRAL